MLLLAAAYEGESLSAFIRKAALEAACSVIERNERFVLGREDAKVIIASRYFDAFRHFGGLPLLRQSYGVQESYEIPRATAEETVNFMTGLLDEAIADANLPWSLGSDEANWQGRMTKAAAMALKCKILVFAASPLYNDSEPYCTESPQDAVDQRHVWYGGYSDEWWSRLYTACTDFFNALQTNGFYQLMQADGTNPQDYRDAYYDAYATRENNTELLISTRVIGQFNGDWWYYFWDWIVGQGGGGPGAFTPTLEFMEMFPMADGRNYPYKDAGVYNTDNPDNIDIFANRDPRMYETMLVNRPKLREDYQGMQSVSIWEGGDIDKNSTLNEWRIRFNSGMALFKWVRDFWKMTEIPSCYSYMRMADMYLIYAEALAETGDLQGACDQINIVRDRVGLGKIEEMNPELHLTANKDNLIEEILRERACEFGLEDERLYDIIRRKCIDKFTSPLHELVIWRKTADGKKDTRDDTTLQPGEPYPNFIYDKQVITTGARRWWEPGFWTNKWLLSPLPRTEINKEYGLFQNPGW